MGKSEAHGGRSAAEAGWQASGEGRRVKWRGGGRETLQARGRKSRWKGEEGGYPLVQQESIAEAVGG